MRKLLLALTLVGALASAQASFAAVDVSITKSGFRPAAVTVAAGTTATWTNADSARHQIVADNGSFSSPVLTASQSYSHVFRAGGTFAYHDALHPSLRGTVAVVPPRTVWITRAGLVPAAISVKAGESVRWVNRTSANHQLVADDAAFSSRVLAPRDAFSHTFASAGTYRYHDGLQPSVTGTVDVTATAVESLTLVSARHVVTYGGSVLLSGRLVNGTPGEKLTLTASPQTGGATKSVQAVTTNADGTFRVSVRPLVQTAYAVAAANSTSSPLVVNVRPRLRLGKAGHGRGVVRVLAARAFTRRYALVQRWNTRRHVWRSITRVRLTRAVPTASPTVVTRAVFRLRSGRGARLRVFMPHSQAAPGYTSNASNAIRV